MSWVRVLPEAAHSSLKMTVLGELHCIALVVSWSEYSYTQFWAWMYAVTLVICQQKMIWRILIWMLLTLEWEHHCDHPRDGCPPSLTSVMGQQSTFLMGGTATAYVVEVAKLPFCIVFSKISFFLLKTVHQEVNWPIYLIVHYSSMLKLAIHFLLRLCMYRSKLHYIRVCM